MNDVAAWMVLAALFGSSTLGLVIWSSVRHVPRREVGQMRGLPMPYYPADRTYEIGSRRE